MSIAVSLELCAYHGVATPSPDAQRQIIASRLKDARRKAKKTQADVARAIDAAEMTISRYERGLYVPESPIATKLADLYGVSVDWLLGRDVAPAPTPESTVERDGETLRAVDEFVASLDDDELAEYREHDEEWGRGLAFKDLRSTLGIEVTASLVRRLWSERRGQRAGKLRPPPKVDVQVPADKMPLPRIGKKR